MSAGRRLLGIRGFLPYLTVVLVNAMIDLGHKIVIQNTVFKVYDGSTQIGLTALVNACILLPFIMFFTPAGFLADRFPKHLVMRWTAFFAVPLTALIYGSYLLGWFEAAFALTLILAAQSAFYSPAKYGYIKEMAGKDNLGMANGVVQAVTIVAILLGGVLFSVVFEALIGQAATKTDILQAIAPSGLLLFAGAVAQTVVALRIPQYKAGDATLRLDRTAYVRG
jgi:acyl-[acyl-carrier-protein]-phospholipid O-acyltransferase/long-chain-fatty-acid--[acyl-carrier-protein] ligase